MVSENDYPYEIKNLDIQESAEILKYFNAGVQNGFLRIGPKNFFIINGFRADAPKIYKMPLRQDDTFVVTVPKSGTTWTQELVWLLKNNLDYEKSTAIPLPMRFPFLEISSVFKNERSQKALRDQCKGDERKLNIIEALLKSGPELVADMPSPRFIKTHVPLSLLPPTLLDTARVLYVARDPRDVAVSYYYHHKLFKNLGFTGDFKHSWKYFVKGQLDWTPYFPHVLEAWEKRHHPNMLFIFYEDMIKDLPGVVRRAAKFLGKELTEDQVSKLSDHLSFQNFKNNKSVNYEFLKELDIIDKNRNFLRKGMAGDWRDHFDEEMAAEAERWIEDNLHGTDLRFPHHGK